MLGPGDRHAIDKTLRGVRANYRSFHLVYPASKTECTACGFDELTQSAQDVNCLTCNGVGYTFTWTTLEVYGRLQYYDFVTLAASGLPPGIELGDAVSYVSEDVKGAAIEVRSSPYGYALIDSNRFRPYSIQPTGVGHADEWRVEWKRMEMNTYASGY